MTSVIAVTPLAGLAVADWLAWGHGVGVTDLLLTPGSEPERTPAPTAR